MARKKRSTHRESGREDRPLAGRRSGRRDAEGSFGAGFLNGSVGSPGVVHVIEYEEKCGEELFRRIKVVP